MRKKIWVASAFFALTGLCASLASCSEPAEKKPSIRIVNGDLIKVAVKQKVKVQCWTENLAEPIRYEMRGFVSFVDDDGWILGFKAGIGSIRVFSGDVWDDATVYVLDPDMELMGWGVFADNSVYRVGDRIRLHPYIEEIRWRYMYEYIEPILLSDPSIASLEGMTLVAKAPGEAVVRGKLMDDVSIPCTVTILPRLE